MKKKLLRIAVTACIFLVSGHWTIAFPLDGVIVKREVNDTIPNSDSSAVDSVSYHLTGLSGLGSSFIALSRDSMDVESAGKYPILALQQHLKGHLKGLYVQTPSMEPGSIENMYIRGITKPLLSHKDIYENQPTVYLNGVPLITDNPFVYDIQKYKFNPIGPATNLLSAIDMDNVASIKILKSPEALASLGPRAANGAIMITTKNAHAGDKKISINGYYGLAPAFDDHPVNAAYMAKIRKPYYDKYATSQNKADYPEYLSNTSDPNYYGPANWTDLYYKTAMLHSINGSLTGGTERANFRFFGGESQGNSGIDGTKINRYTAAFSINMLPLTWLTVSTSVKATRLNRDRNKSLRDRLAEMNYFPDLTYPLAPNKALYNKYLNYYDDGFDKNSDNVIDGSFSLKAVFRHWVLSSQLAFDYNEGVRDVFWPSSLLEDNNYASHYYGSNRRLLVDNKVKYKNIFNQVHHFSVEVGQSLQAEKNAYNYAYAYKGPSDYIKINVVDGDKNHDDYLEPNIYIGNRFLDRLKSHLLSFYGHAKYSYKDILSVDAILRNDASSFAQPTSRWFISPAFSVDWNLKNNLLLNSNKVNQLDVKLSWGRIGKLFPNAMMGAGPQYRVDLGWSGERRMPSYNGVATLTRPYSYGWVGYNIKWPYSETKSLNISASLFHHRLSADITAYLKDDKRMVLGIPTISTSGFVKSFEQGLWVRNKGLEIGLEGVLIKNKSAHILWILGGNVSMNKNTLKALPGGLDEVIIENQKLVVGEAIDRFWLLHTKGIYKSDADVPINPMTNEPMTYKGVSLKGGDADWQDVNGDYVIDDKDKVLTGHILPKFVGGFNTAFEWKGLSLSADFYYAIGQKVLNKNVANRLDFINVSAAKDINTTQLKDVTFWRKTFDHSQYPEFNPWSDAKPYQLDQDLYLQNASYLKLRTLSLGYDLAKSGIFKKTDRKFDKLLIYLSANNILTVTPYPDGDPEIANYQGYYTGYGMPFMKSYTIGLKVDF